MSKWGRKRERPPPGFEVLSSTLNALEHEMRAKIHEPHEGKRKAEMLWPIHQINNQRSRYVYDMFYVHKRISRTVYDYCLRQKLVDASLIAKWKKPGYDRLCSTFAINTRNYPYGTVSICRVPRHFLRKGQIVQDSHSGCRGCSSGKGGYHNIFGNKYGQRLAAIQMMREKMSEPTSAPGGVDDGRLINEDGSPGLGHSDVWEYSGDALATSNDCGNSVAGTGDERARGDRIAEGHSLPKDVSAMAQEALSAWHRHGRTAFAAKKKDTQQNAQAAPPSKRPRLG